MYRYTEPTRILSSRLSAPALEPLPSQGGAEPEKRATLHARRYSCHRPFARSAAGGASSSPGHTTKLANTRREGKLLSPLCEARGARPHQSSWENAHTARRSGG